MASDPVWSIIWMVGILIVLVGVALYYIFMYDTWYPNEQSESEIGPQPRNQDSDLGSESGTYDGPREGTYSTSSC